MVDSSGLHSLIHGSVFRLGFRDSSIPVGLAVITRDLGQGDSGNCRVGASSVGHSLVSRSGFIQTSIRLPGLIQQLHPCCCLNGPLAGFRRNLELHLDLERGPSPWLF